MRKIIIIICFAMAALASSAQSPISFHAKAGIGTSNFWGKHSSSETRIAYKAGIGAEYALSRTWVVQSALEFVSIGGKDEIKYVKGFLNGTQTKLKYVPEQDTDFIFCTVGEEEGFIGSTAVLLLFLALILRLIALAERQQSAFGRVYGYSVLSIFLFHLFINIGMVLGLTPVIGIPLPFFSYGGSSLWGFTILLFIFLRIDAGRNRRLV